MSTIIMLIVVAAIGFGIYRVLGKGKEGDQGSIPSHGKDSLSAGARHSGPASAAPGTSAPPQARKNWLVATGGELAGKSFFVGQRMITVGRAPTNQVQLTDAAISRTHCQISPAQGGLRVIDMASKGSVFVNGKPVNDAVISAQDELKIGESTFRFQLEIDGAQDAALGRKSGAPEMNKSTAMAMQSGLDKRVDPKVAAAIEKCGGDLDAAAKKLGMEPEVLKLIFGGSPKP